LVLLQIHAVVVITVCNNVAAMHIQLSQSMFTALSASQLGYIMRQRGEVEVKVKQFLPVVLVSSDRKLYLF